MKRTLKHYSIFALSLCTLFFTGCEKNLYSEKSETKEDISFDFATTKNYTLDVNYHLPEGYEIIFEVYTENPVNEYGVKIEGVHPIFKGMTSNGGQYSSTTNQSNLNLPTYVKEVYIYSGSVGVPEVVKVPVSNSGVSMNTATKAKSYAMAKPASKAGTAQYLALGSWDATGIPSYIEHTVIPASLMKDINYSLPKSKSVVDRHPDFLKSEIVTNLNIKTPTEIEITLTHAGAAMKNTLAYFQYTTGQEPTSDADIANKIIIFPNLTSSLIGNGLNAGDKVKLKYWNGTSFENTFPAGVSIGWVMFVNAYQNGNITEGTWKNYSIPSLNVRENADKQQHNIMLYDKERNLYVIAFEDQLRSSNVCDNDFHDAIFYIQASDANAIDNNGVANIDKWIDSDNDGVCDAEDEFPNDPTAAFTIHYPAQGVNGTLAFEDLWPSRGDYDLNDVVVFYHSIHAVSAYNKIARTEDKFDFVYSGAGVENGFGYQLGISSGRVKSLDITSDFTNDDMSIFKFDSKGLEANQSKATIILASNVGQVVQGNTRRASCTVKTVFTSSLYLNELTVPPYNPFIISNTGTGKRDTEVHLPYFAPTSLADMSNFGTYDDKTDITKGSYFLSNSYFPFALQIPEEFAYPDETIRIDVNYPEFIKWAESQGTTNQDWYKNKKNNIGIIE